MQKVTTTRAPLPHITDERERSHWTGNAALGTFKARFTEAEVWFGEHTGQWWALACGQLIEASSRNRLAELLAGLYASQGKTLPTDRVPSAPFPERPMPSSWLDGEPEPFVEPAPVTWLRDALGAFLPPWRRREPARADLRRPPGHQQSPRLAT
ncbi:hypothetical protein LO762_29865 [Actinocorallia sp. API 0066]|uniref:hypothetical protein n=1 Tax=Actinocorallia sp. API 0066 TaxID=2896846 RepID=UPI001E2C591F|nr:hypothetical protein [Actinocorallia sp. API 0066]MCD0453356.1 hypothetical protein [Actinocorallia sp. API 0066]